MKICSACHTENPDAAKFCRGCGHPLNAVARSTEPVQISTPVNEPTTQTVPSTAQVQPHDSSNPTPTATVGGQIPTGTPQADSAKPSLPGQGVPTTQPPSQNIPPQGATPAQPYATYPQFEDTQQPSQQQSGAAFGNWLLSSLTQPSITTKVELWWTVVVMVASALSMGLLSYIWTWKAVSLTTSIGNNLLGSSGMGFYSQSHYSTLTPSISVLFQYWIAFLILVYAQTLSIFVGRKILGDDATFWQIHDMFARRLVPFTAFCLVLVFISVIGGSGLAVPLFLIGFSIIMVAWPIAMITTGSCTRKLDHFWVWVLAILAAGAIMFIALLVFAGICGARLSSLY